MNAERKIIELITSIMPESKNRVNKCFESDSELIKFGKDKLLFSLDGFSGEDMFQDRHPYNLGWNMAVGGLSDILACGGKPQFYAHSICAAENWDNKFIKNLTEGIADVLKISKTEFIGGDFGKANEWGYTAAVIGSIKGKQLTRKGASLSDVIYITGRIGIGNVQAALILYSEDTRFKKFYRSFSNKFELRIKESLLIKKYATACIDTSDGVFNALNTISELNNTGYIVKDPPYVKNGIVLAKQMSMPKSLLFLGECGEYELLFTMREKDEEEFLKRAKKKKMEFYKIGRVSPRNKKVLIEDGKEINLKGINIRARDYGDMNTYLSKLTDYISR